MIQRFSAMVRMMAPWVCLRTSGESSVPSLWDGDDWQEMTLEDLPHPTPFGCCVWLIAEEHTCFKHRTFPADLVDANSLDEAVALDLQSWSPWGEKSGCFHWSVRDGEQWRVAVWIWDADRESALRERVSDASDIAFTHVMPEQAWRASGMGVAGNSALLLWPAQEGVTCVLMDEHGIPAKIASVAGEAEGIRFWRSIGGSEGKNETLFLLDAEGERNLPSWLPDINTQVLKPCLPSRRVLARARLPGVQDWTDPLVWRKPLAALATLWLLWLAGSSAILWNRNAIVEAELQQARVSAEEVLSLRDRVRLMHNHLETVNALRHRQGRKLRFLAELSKKLPSDAWLLSLVDEGSWVNIQGRAKHAAAIGAALEDLSEIDHVNYVGNIRPDIATQRESFHIRIHFTEASE